MRCFCYVKQTAYQTTHALCNVVHWGKRTQKNMSFCRHTVFMYDLKFIAVGRCFFTLFPLKSLNKILAVVLRSYKKTFMCKKLTHMRFRYTYRIVCQLCRSVSLHVCADSSEPSLLRYIKHEYSVPLNP